MLLNHQWVHPNANTTKFNKTFAFPPTRKLVYNVCVVVRRWNEWIWYIFHVYRAHIHIFLVARATVFWLHSLVYKIYRFFVRLQPFLHISPWPLSLSFAWLKHSYNEKMFSVCAFEKKLMVFFAVSVFTWIFHGWSI